MNDAIDKGIDRLARSTCARFVAVDDLNPLMHAAMRSIGCGWYDLRDSELNEIQQMVEHALDVEHAREDPRYGVRVGYARN